MHTDADRGVFGASSYQRLPPPHYLVTCSWSAATFPTKISLSEQPQPGSSHNVAVVVVTIVGAVITARFVATYALCHVCGGPSVH